MAGRDLFATQPQMGRDLFAIKKEEDEKIIQPVEPAKKQEEPGFLEMAAGVGETAMAIGSSIVAEPVSGIAGIYGTATDGLEEGVQAIEQTQAAMTYQPRTETGQQYLKSVGEFLAPIGEALKSAETYLGEAGYEAGGPIVGAVGATIPTAAMELLGLKGINTLRGAKQVSGITDEAAETLKSKGVDIDDISEEGLAKIQDQAQRDALNKVEETKPPEKKKYQTILKDIENQKTKKSAGQVMPDQEIIQAAKDLGIDLNPSHYSTNKAYIELEQSLKSRPGSTLSAKELQAIDDLGKQADQLITSFGGQIDKSLLDAKVKQDISGTIQNLSDKAGVAYKNVEAAIPKSTIIDLPSSKSYIEQTLEDLGGDKSLLSVAEKQLYKLTKSENPTYAALDRVRKDIGKGFKGKGVYKDDNSGILRRIYAQIGQDQQNIADAFGIGKDYELGRKLVSDRKLVEDQSIKLFGKEVNKSLVPQMKAAATSLTKGDISKFDKLMDSLPSHLREEAAVTMIGDLFVQDARSATGISQGFVKAFEGLNRNKQAKVALMKHIPQDARKQFNNIGKVATGLYKSKALENTSKTARDLISALEDGGLFKRITDTTAKVAAAEGVTSTIGLPGAGAAGVLGSVLTRGRKSASQAADEFVTSKKFTEAVEEAASGNLKNADEMIKKSKVFKRWIRFADPGDVEAIMAIGFIPWVTGQTEGE